MTGDAQILYLFARRSGKSWVLRKLWEIHNMQQQYPTPTVGRKVYFLDGDEHNEFGESKVLDATIIQVNAPTWQVTPFTSVNLFVIDGDGNTYVAKDVQHSPTPVPYPHYCWMPYQLEQVNKKATNELALGTNTCAAGGQLKGTWHQR